MSTDELRLAALTLPASERARLAQDLLRSLDGATDVGAEAAWIAELTRRAQEMTDGTVKPVEWQAARERIARQLHERRR
jgi:putative addiction module component (TIGR02574 family)